MEVDFKFKDGISESLIGLERALANTRPVMAEVGQLMVTMIRESHDANVGMDGKPMAKVSKEYGKRKLAAGGNPGRILFGPSPGGIGGGGDLHRSWNVRHITPTVVAVGATGGVLNAIKASAHDGGLAQYLGKPRLNRLRMGWTDKTLTKACAAWMDELQKQAGA